MLLIMMVLHCDWFLIDNFLLLAGQKGGCIIVDSTRKGKRFPDSMSKTIPIWTCVLNRAILNYRNKVDKSALGMEVLSYFNV